MQWSETHCEVVGPQNSALYKEMVSCFLLVWGSNFMNPSGLDFPILNKSLNRVASRQKACWTDNTERVNNQKGLQSILRACWI